MFFDNDFKGDKLSLFLEYENLIEFEKCILAFALYKEFNATKYDLSQCKCHHYIFLLYFFIN